MKPILALALSAAVAAEFAFAVPQAGAETIRVQPAEGAVGWNLWYGPTQVLVYAFGAGQFKPYVKELRTTSGENLLRDAPHDHLHHHALMYGIKVNGVNFWEETSGSGVQKPVQSPPPELGVGLDGQPQARVLQVIHWVTPEDAFLPDTTSVALLIEQRTITLTINQVEEEVALEWRSQFQVGHKTNTVMLTGSSYHGLGVRFLEELDAPAAHSLAGRDIDLSNSRQDVSPSPWGQVNFERPGRPAAFVIAGHPGNERGNSVFFSMKTPFAYLSATQGLDKAPLVYRSGDEFTVRFLVLVYPKIKSAETIDRRVTRWRGTP